MAESPGSPVPQFDTAEYAEGAGRGACKACGRPLGATQFRVNGLPTCADCAQSLKARFPPDSHAAFVRGIACGALGAVVGLILYVVFAVTTGLVIGFVSLAVGYIVGKAMTVGSQGRGGRRYQVAAVLLTYAAVSLAAVPIAIISQSRHGHAQEQAQVQQPDRDTAAVPRQSLGEFVGHLALLGLASPFLDLADPANGVIGLIILFVGLRIAWTLTAGRSLEILGPFDDVAGQAHG